MLPFTVEKWIMIVKNDYYQMVIFQCRLRKMHANKNVRVITNLLPCRKFICCTQNIGLKDTRKTYIIKLKHTPKNLSCIKSFSSSQIWARFYNFMILRMSKNRDTCNYCLSLEMKTNANNHQNKNYTLTTRDMLLLFQPHDTTIQPPII